MGRMTGRIDRLEEVLGLHANFLVFLLPAWAVAFGKDDKDLTNRVLVFAGPRSEALRKALVESYREEVFGMDRRKSQTQPGHTPKPKPRRRATSKAPRSRPK